MKSYTVVMQVWVAVRADDGEDAEAIAMSRHTWDDFGVFSVESVTPDDDRDAIGSTCLCPGDCNCRHQGEPWRRPNLCGCKAHATDREPVAS